MSEDVDLDLVAKRRAFTLDEIRRRAASVYASPAVTPMAMVGRLAFAKDDVDYLLREVDRLTRALDRTTGELTRARYLAHPERAPQPTFKRLDVDLGVLTRCSVLPGDVPGPRVLLVPEHETWPDPPVAVGGGDHGTA